MIGPKTTYDACMNVLPKRINLLLSLCLIAVAAAWWLVPSVKAATYSVTIDETKFVPSALKVKLNDMVTFINTTDATQSAKTASLTGFNTGAIGPGQSKSVSMDTAGTFAYTSAYNATLTGTITVESTTATTTATPTPTPTSTISATTTTTKGAMPVSGTTEVLIALLASGAGLILFGIVTSKWNTSPALIEDIGTVEIDSVEIDSTQ